MDQSTTDLTVADDSKHEHHLFGGDSNERLGSDAGVTDMNDSLSAASDLPADSRPTLCFTRLPSEIRDLIYEFAVVPERHIIMVACNAPDDNGFTGALSYIEEPEMPSHGPHYELDVVATGPDYKSRYDCKTRKPIIFDPEESIRNPYPKHPGLKLFLVSREVYASASRIFYTKAKFQTWGPERSAAMYGFALFLMDRPSAIPQIRYLSIDMSSHDRGKHRYECAASLLQRLLPTMTGLRELRLVIRNRSSERLRPGEYLTSYEHHFCKLVASSIKGLKTLTIWIEESVENKKETSYMRPRVLTGYAQNCIEMLRGELLPGGARCGQTQILSGDVPYHYLPEGEKEEERERERESMGVKTDRKEYRIKFFVSADTDAGNTLLEKDEKGRWKIPGFEPWYEYERNIFWSGVANTS